MATICAEIHALSPAQYDIDAGQDKIGLRTRELADALGEQRPVQGNYLRHVRDRILRQAGMTSFEKHIAGGIGPF